MTKAYIVTDLSYGDAGKGTTVDYLARQASTVVVRHNGGPQAAHNVVTADGHHHTFAQFGSGSFVPGTRTHLSRFMLINPINMFLEADHLIKLGMTDIWERTSVERAAMIITPWHQAANRLREKARGGGRHGSCAQGVGEAMASSIERPDLTIRARDIDDGLIAKLQAIRLYLLHLLQVEVGPVDESDEDWRMLADSTLAYTLEDIYLRWASLVSVVDGSYLLTLADTCDQLVFEGAQGVLLDEWYGFHPYTTWSTTTSANALQLLDEIGFTGQRTRLGILRAYTTRHGPGPFVTEDSTLDEKLPELHNGTGQWQGAFRYGHLDLVAHQYAIAANGGIDELVVTGLDRSNEWQYCREYNPPDTPDGDRYFDMSSGRVGSIRVGTLGDLDYQARLTELLSLCQPYYHSPSVVNDSQLLQVIEQHLGAPISLISYGPTAMDKRALVAS